MRKALAILAFLVGATFVAAVDDTRSIRPRADGEGSIGGGGRAWGTGVFNRVEADFWNEVPFSQVVTQPVGVVGGSVTTSVVGSVKTYTIQGAGGEGGPAQPASFVLLPLHSPQVATASTNDQISWSEYAGRLVGASSITTTGDLTAAGFVCTVTGSVGTAYASFDFQINPYCDAPTSISWRIRGVNSLASPPVIRASYPAAGLSQAWTSAVYSADWSEEHFAVPSWVTGRQSQVLSVQIASSQPALTNGTWSATLVDMSHGVRLHE